MMGRLRAGISSAAPLLLVLASGSRADAHDTCASVARAPTVTWGVTRASDSSDASPEATATSAVSRARDLMARAKFLDEVATIEEKTAFDLGARMPALKMAARTAREKADRAKGEAKEALAARAEHLETDATVSEAEAVEKRRSAVENRRIARELRARAIKIVREGAIEEDGACDPPFRFTADGRKIYRLECLK